MANLFSSGMSLGVTSNVFVTRQVRLHSSELLGNDEMKIVLACIVLNPMVNGLKL
jgi:hypothetical protein